MQNKTALITGGTSGIGHSTATLLAKEGFDVFIVGRSEEPCKLVVEELKQINPNGNFGYYLCDLLSQEQIRRMAEQVRLAHKHIDVLVNNAGGVFAARELTDEGFEKTFALNHLAYFTLTRELLPLLQAAPEPRIVCVSSNSHLSGKIDWDNLQGEKNYFIMSQYGNTKLMNVLFVKELARRLAGTGITANALHPGVVKTKIGNKSRHAFFGTAWQVWSTVAGISEARGAATSVYLASSPEVKGVTGRYFSNCKQSKVNPIADDEATAKKLWDATEELLAR